MSMSQLQGLKNYSHCPLKKRPLAFINDYDTDDEQPQDLSIKRRRHESDDDVIDAQRPPTTSPETPHHAHVSPVPTHFLQAPSSPPRMTSLADFYLKLFQTSAVQQCHYEPQVDLWRRTPVWAAAAGSPMVSQSNAHHHPSVVTGAQHHNHHHHLPPHHLPQHLSQTGMVEHHSALAARLASTSHPSEDRLASPGSTVSEDSGVGTETLSEDEIDVTGDATVEVSINSTGDQSLPAHPSSSFSSSSSSSSSSSKGDSRYSCTECRKSYSTYSGLSKHKQFHCAALGAKSFGCKHCDKVYTSLGALKMHIRTHTLPCKCPLCGKAFSRPWLLQGHIRTHTGEKPFQCSQCDRCFADRSNLRAHLQTHADIKKYACSTCHKTFSRMSLLNKHTEASCPARIASQQLQRQQVPPQQEFQDPLQQSQRGLSPHDDCLPAS